MPSRNIVNIASYFPRKFENDENSPIAASSIAFMVRFLGQVCEDNGWKQQSKSLFAASKMFEVVNKPSDFPQKFTSRSDRNENS